jgi:hypothetical protein
MPEQICPSYRNAPYPEEPKHVIDPESIKIITHLDEALVPPVKMILGHLLPVVRRETPILSLHCKRIRRRASLELHVVQIRFNPCITTKAMYANRNISFNDYSILVRIIHRIFQLQMQMKLYEIMDRYIVEMLGFSRNIFFDR